MTLSYLGEITIGEAIPFAIVVNAQLAQAIALALAEIEGHLAGLLKVSASIAIKPPAFLATIQGLAAVTASLRLAGPSVTLQATAVLDIIAGLKLQIKALQAMIKFPLGGQLHAYFYDGIAGNFGAEVSAATSGGFPGGSPTDHTDAVILAAVEPQTTILLKSVFKWQT